MILYLVICVILLLYRLSIKYHTSQPSPVSGLYDKGHVFRDLNNFNMYTRGGGGGKGGSLEDSNTSVDTKPQNQRDESYQTWK